jgi:hypothetical protein
MHFNGYSVDIDVVDVQDAVFLHEWLCVCSWWFVENESDYFFMYDMEWFQVLFGWLFVSPDGDCVDDMWVTE